MTTYPLAAVRALALHAQGLAAPNHASPSPTLATIQKTVEQLNYVQIDTLNLIQRSQYIALWSRLGRYAPADFDRLVYSPEERKLFEGLQSVAAIIPLKDYRYQIPHMDRERVSLINWYTRMLEGHDSQALMAMVLERIQREGGLRASDFEYLGPQRGGWWEWKH